MKHQTLLPTTVQENEYFTLPVASYIFGVGERQTRNVASAEGIEKAYYSTSSNTDLVCYRAIDVYRVAMGRRNVWPDPWPKEYNNGFIQKSETYDSAKRIIINKSRKELEEIVQQHQPPVEAQTPKAEVEQPHYYPSEVPHEQYLALLADLVDEVKRQAATPSSRSNKYLTIFQFFVTLIIIGTFLYCVSIGTTW